MYRTAVTLVAAVIVATAGTGLALAVRADHRAADRAAAISGPLGSARATAAATGGVVTARRSRYGTVLFDGRGFALYLFTRERGRAPACSGACASAWPPFLSRGRPRGGSGARASLVGWVRRRDGSRQVTYGGHPLYRYVGDRRPGDILCQNVVEFGGTWLVVAPSGAPVRQT